MKTIIKGQKIAVFLLFFLGHFAVSSLAQTADSIPPPYKRYPTLPPFELRGMDSSLVKRDDMPAHKATILMYFSPDCSHCLEQTEQFKTNIKKLGKYNLVFASYQPFEEIRTYYENNKMRKWKNLFIGRDEKYFLPPFYRISNLPYLALYDRNGQLIKTYEGTTNLTELLKNFEASPLTLKENDLTQ